MRFVFLGTLLMSIAAAVSAGCGGTSSESPWPIEPEHRELGPAGESNGAAKAAAPDPSDDLAGRWAASQTSAVTRWRSGGATTKRG